MKIKTSELTGMQLDYAVDLIEGGYADYLKRHAYAEAQAAQYIIHEPREPLTFRDLLGTPTCPKYSTDWSIMGPIIDRERINLEPFKDINGEQWSADGQWDSPTPLIAAARYYVASKLGSEADVPEELL